MQGFRHDPDTYPPFADDWVELLQGTDWHLEYRLLLLARTRRNYPKEVGEEADELRSIYGDDPDKVRVIDDVVDGSPVPRFKDGDQYR